MTSDQPADAADNAAKVAALRAGIAAVEGASQGIADRAAAARAQAKKDRSRSAPTTRKPTNFEHDIPDRDDWIDSPPPGIVDGRGGVELRLVRELAAVRVRSYQLSPLTKLSTIPEAIPIFVDWLANLETKIPGPETTHRATIRTGLLRNLIDPAARGNRAAVAAVVAQLGRRPALPNEDQWWAGQALEVIAGKQDYSTGSGLVRGIGAGQQSQGAAAGLPEQVQHRGSAADRHRPDRSPRHAGLRRQSPRADEGAGGAAPIGAHARRLFGKRTKMGETSPEANTGIIDQHDSETVAMQWRNTTSPGAQNDLDMLVHDGLGTASEALRVRDCFAPFMLTVGIDGDKSMRRLDDSGRMDEHAIRSALTIDGDVGQLRARATVYAVTVREPFVGDAIKVAAEHREGISIDLLVPYTVTDDAIEIDMNAANAAMGSRHLWQPRSTF
jgi:hypothetical protein